MGTRQRREREAAQRRDLILQTARKLFWKQGYAGTTMPQIAEKVELAPGTLYLYFSSKSALYAEILADGYDVLQPRLEEAARAAGTQAQRAERLVDAFLGFAQEFPGYFDIIFFVLQREEGGWQGSLESEQVARLEERENACKAVVGQVLRDAGHAHADGQPTCDAIWSMLAGVIFFFKKGQRFGEVAAEARRIVLQAVLSDAPA